MTTDQSWVAPEHHPFPDFGTDLKLSQSSARGKPLKSTLEAIAHHHSSRCSGARTCLGAIPNDPERGIKSVEFVTSGTKTRDGVLVRRMIEPEKMPRAAESTRHGTSGTAAELADKIASIMQWKGPSQGASRSSASLRLWGIGRRCKRVSWTYPFPSLPARFPEPRLSQQMHLAGYRHPGSPDEPRPPWWNLQPLAPTSTKRQLGQPRPI